MSISSATVASNALGFLGEQPILTLLDESVRARLVNGHFAILRDAILADHLWNFAKRRVVLVAESVAAPVFDYAYTFALPTDYIKMVKFNPQWADYEIQGNTLVTSAQEAMISYIARITDLNAWHPIAVLAFEYKLAAAVSPVLKSDYKITEMMEGMYESWIRKAKIADAQDERSKEVLSDDLIDARRVN